MVRMVYIYIYVCVCKDAYMSDEEMRDERIYILFERRVDRIADSSYHCLIKMVRMVYICLCV